MIPRNFMIKFVHVGVYRTADVSHNPFPAWYGVAHLKTGIEYPLRFEFYSDAMSGAQELDVMCNWDAYVEGIGRDVEWDQMEITLARNLFAIADLNCGVLLPGDPLNHQEIALLMKQKRDPNPPEMRA